MTCARYLSDLEWSKHAAASAVDELLVAQLISEEKADWAREIVAQDIHIQLASGIRPKESES
jgi:hypothetical protein